MLQITSNNIYSTPLKNSVNFGKKELEDTEANKGGRTPEEIKAKKLEMLAKKAQTAGRPSAMKSFTIVAALMSASALTAAALSGRFFIFLDKMGALKKVSKGTTILIEKLHKKIYQIHIADKNSLKAKTLKYTKQAVKYVEDLSKYGIEDNLNRQMNKKARKIAEIRKYIQKANPAKKFTKQEMKLAIKEEIARNETFRKELEEITNKINDAKGANLLKKTTKASFAAAAGTGALTEAAKDGDNNGIPDCVEYNKAHKEATQKFTAAIIDCALDSL